MIYLDRDGTWFEGPLFHPRMELAGIAGKTYLTVFIDKVPAYRVELKVDADGTIVYPDEE